MEPTRSGGRRVHFAEPIVFAYSSNPAFASTTSPQTTVHHPSTGNVAGELTPTRPLNPEETASTSAGSRPCYIPDTTDSQESSEEPGSSDTVKGVPRKPRAWSSWRKEARKVTGMAEPRARAARHKGQMNFAPELRLLLLAYGDPNPHHSFPAEPLPETVRVLDEIVTDFVMEMCHAAAQYASYARRQKIKVDDFRFALRRDPGKLGRVQELLRMERELKEARKAFDQNDDQIGTLKETGKKGIEELGESVDGTTGGGKKVKGKGKRGARRDSDATEETVSKKRKVE